MSMAPRVRCFAGFSATARGMSSGMIAPRDVSSGIITLAFEGSDMLGPPLRVGTHDRGTLIVPEHALTGVDSHRERPHCQRALTSTRLECPPIQLECPPIHPTQTPIDRARTAIALARTPIGRAGVPIAVAATSIELARAPTDRTRSPTLLQGTPTERESVPMERSWTPTRRAGIPSGRHRIPTDRERTATLLQRTPIDRARTACGNVRTEIVLQGTAFQRARVARLAQRPHKRTTASGRGHQSARPDVPDPAGMLAKATCSATSPRRSRSSSRPWR